MTVPREEKQDLSSFAFLETLIDLVQCTCNFSLVTQVLYYIKVKCAIVSILQS